MLSKIDVRDIWRDHLNTLVTSDRKPLRGDKVVQFLLPGLIGIALVWKGVLITGAASGVFITALAIFAGLLLNLLLLIHGLIKRTKLADRKSDAGRLLKELYSNLAYGVLVAVLAILPLLVMGLTPPGWLTVIMSFLVYAMTLNFFLTLLMILKRVHTLLSNEFN